MDFKSLVNNNVSMKKIIPVPYISQFSKEFDEEWHYSACGVACVAMLLGYYNLEDISPMKLIEEGVAIGGYKGHGWYHDSLARLLRNHGVNAYTQEFRSVEVSTDYKSFSISPLEAKMVQAGIAKIITEIDAGHPVLVSVNEHFNTNLEKHIILIVGYDFSDGQEKFIVHDSRGLNSHGIVEAFEAMPVDISKFIKFWRKFAIFSYL